MEMCLRWKRGRTGRGSSRTRRLEEIKRVGTERGGVEEEVLAGVGVLQVPRIDNGDEEEKEWINFLHFNKERRDIQL